MSKIYSGTSICNVKGIKKGQRLKGTKIKNIRGDILLYAQDKNNPGKFRWMSVHPRSLIYWK